MEIEGVENATENFKSDVQRFWHFPELAIHWKNEFKIKVLLQNRALECIFYWCLSNLRRYNIDNLETTYSYQVF